MHFSSVLIQPGLQMKHQKSSHPVDFLKIIETCSVRCISKSWHFKIQYVTSFTFLGCLESHIGLITNSASISSSNILIKTSTNYICSSSKIRDTKNIEKGNMESQTIGSFLGDCIFSSPFVLLERNISKHILLA